VQARETLRDAWVLRQAQSLVLGLLRREVGWEQLLEGRWHRWGVGGIRGYLRTLLFEDGWLVLRETRDCTGIWYCRRDGVERILTAG
jgi:hypothetical protein